MTPENIVLTQLCVEHWNCKNLDVSHRTTADECPFCQCYYTIDGDCEGCPIFDFTGYKYCGKTPYDNVCEAEEILDAQGDNTPDFEFLCDSVEKEVEFLISLLPEKFQREYDE